VTRTSLACSVLFAALTATGPLAADPPEATASEPLAMSADEVDLDVEARTARLEGHVEIKKGAMIVRCPRVDVRYDRVPHVTWARGSGGVVAEVKGVKAEAPEVEIDLAGRTLELRGGARLTRGEGWLTAERATIHLGTGKVSMTGVKGSIPAEAAPDASKRGP
jgi:lipopolysaccharide transport protein LptA